MCFFICCCFFFFFFFNDTATTEIYTLSLHDALPICVAGGDVTDHFAKCFCGAVGGQDDDPARLRSAPPQLTERDRIRSHCHPLNGQVCTNCESAGSSRPEVECKCEIDRGVREDEDESCCSWPPQMAGQGEVRERERGNHQERQVVHVLMRAQDQRSCDCECEIEARLVGPPAQGQRYECQQQDENRQSHALAAAGHRLENVAKRVDGGVRVDDLAVGRQGSADGPSADRIHIAQHRSKAESSD